MRTLFVATIWVACITAVLAQAVPAPALLEIDIENLVEYQWALVDPSRFASGRNITPAVPPKNFVGHPVGISLSPTARPGQAIADTNRISIGVRTFEILKTDGTPIGTIVAEGLNGGFSPPGSDVGGQNFAIVGGTGAFLGARGQQGGRQFAERIAPRAASIAEDPADRRRNGGGKVRWVLGVIPIARPEIISDGGEPLITHVSNHKPVTSANPAAPGEWLSLIATGLGPTVPSVDFGKPFPPLPPATVNSPLQVHVNGQPSEVRAAFGPLR